MILESTLVLVLLVSGELGREDHYYCNHFNRHTHTYHSLWCGGVDIQNFTLSIQVEWKLLMGNTQVTRYLGLLDISESTHSIEYIQLLEALRVHTTMTTYSGSLTTCTVHV